MIFKGGKLFYRDRFQSLDMRVEGNRIVEIGEALHGDRARDMTGKKLLPGLVDVHSHGCVGYDFSNASVEEMRRMCLHYAGRGVTAVLATTMTNPVDTIRTAMSNVHELMEEQKERRQGARVLGVNMEGPFLGADKKGAHDPQYLMPPDEKLYDELFELSGGNIRLTDIDPTYPQAMDFIRRNKGRTKISLAHTSCTYELAEEAVKEGATQVTHLFNAMNGLHHRKPGLIGAVCDFPLYAEIIGDGIHVHPAVLRMMFRLIPERMIFISDSMSAAGLSDGEYQLGGLKVYVREGHANLADGTIAGSTITVYDALKNAVRFGIPEEAAVASATRVPAQAVGCGEIAGVLEEGRRADFLIAGEDLSLEEVYCDGCQVERS